MTHNFENSVLTITRDDGWFVKLSHNPETLTSFNSELEALQYANSATLYFVEPDQIIAPKKVSPIEFKLLFTSAERIAIKTSTDPIVQDFYDITNDARLTHIDLGLKSTQDAIAYLVSINILTQSRADAILTGAPV
jgi:hypothetical protein